MCCAQTFRRSIKHDVEPDHCVLVLGALGAGSGRWVGSRLWALDFRRWVLESKLWVVGCRPQWRQGVGSKSTCRVQKSGLALQIAVEPVCAVGLGALGVASGH